MAHKEYAVSVVIHGTVKVVADEDATWQEIFEQAEQVISDNDPTDFTYQVETPDIAKVIFETETGRAVMKADCGGSSDLPLN